MHDKRGNFALEKKVPFSVKFVLKFWNQQLKKKGGGGSAQGNVRGTLTTEKNSGTLQ